MSDLLALHRLAAARGDGLHPKLLELMESRAALTGADPRVVEISASRDGFVQAGPCPSPKMPEFLPGNVVGFAPRAKAAQAAAKESSVS